MVALVFHLIVVGIIFHIAFGQLLFAWLSKSFVSGRFTAAFYSLKDPQSAASHGFFLRQVPNTVVALRV